MSNASFAEDAFAERRGAVAIVLCAPLLCIVYPGNALAQPVEGGAKCRSKHANPASGHQFEFKFFFTSSGDQKGGKFGNPDSRFGDDGIEMTGLGYGVYEAKIVTYPSFGPLRMEVQFNSSGYVIRRFIGKTLFQQEEGVCDYERAKVQVWGERR